MTDRVLYSSAFKNVIKRHFRSDSPKSKCAIIASVSLRLRAATSSFFILSLTVNKISPPREARYHLSLSEKYSSRTRKEHRNILRDAVFLFLFSITITFALSFFATLEIRSLPRPRYFFRFTFFATKTRGVT